MDTAPIFVISTQDVNETNGSNISTVERVKGYGDDLIHVLDSHADRQPVQRVQERCNVTVFVGLWHNTGCCILHAMLSAWPMYRVWDRVQAAVLRGGVLDDGGHFISCCRLNPGECDTATLS